MSNIKPTRLTQLLAITAAVAGLTACNGPLELPLEFDSPTTTINVDDHIGALEASMCADMTSRDCLIIQELDKSDDDAVSTPPAIPAEFPKSISIDIAGQAQEFDVATWLNDPNGDGDTEDGFLEVARFAQIIDIDVTNEMDAQSPEGLNNVAINSVKFFFPQNSLTFATVPVQLFLLPSDTNTDGADARALIDDGTAKLVGTIPAQPAGATAELDFAFEDGGKTSFVDALLNMKFKAILAVPADAPIALPDGAAANTFAKPAGILETGVRLSAVFSFDGAGALGGLTGQE